MVRQPVILANGRSCTTSSFGFISERSVESSIQMSSEGS